MPPTFCAAACALALCLAAAPAHADGDMTPLTSLVALSSQRLALAEPVAHWKWNHRQPVENPAADRALLAQVEKRAATLGVEPAYARAFFADQIAAGYALQNRLFDTWRKTPPDAAAPDLAHELQPKLDQLTQQLLAGLARATPLSDTPDCPTRIADSIANWNALTRYDGSRAAALAQALGHVCAAGGVGAVADAKEPGAAG